MTNKGTQEGKKVHPGKRRGGSIKNKPPLNTLTDISYLNFINLASKYYSLKYPSVRDLILICHHFTKYNSGINPDRIINDSYNSDGTFRALYFRLKLLKARGLISCIDRKYYPTESAIKELSDLLRSAG